MVRGLLLPLRPMERDAGLAEEPMESLDALGVG